MSMTGKLTVATPSDREIVMTRSFDAPRRLVWDAMTRPDLIRQWLFTPPGWTMTVCEEDVRVGGKYRWAWSGPDGKTVMSMHGVYREVEPLRRLVRTETFELGCDAQAGEQIGTLEFSEQADRTTLTIRVLYPSKAARDATLASGMEHGVAAGYDRLEASLNALRVENAGAAALSFAERFRHWYEYERDCNAKTLAMLRSVPAQARGSAAFTRAVGRMAHLVAARHMWLHRLGVSSDRPADWFPSQTLDQLAPAVEDIERRWVAYLANLSDADLARPIECTTENGRRFRWRLVDLLTQVFGHAWYHRGQIAMLVKDLGGEPVDTDYIYWDRPTPLDAPQTQSKGAGA